MRHMLSTAMFIPMILLMAACTSTAGRPIGMDSATTSQSVDVVFAGIEASMAANEAVGVVASVDHAANAASAGLTLPPAKVLLFGNPALGTPVMMRDIRAGLDLPQKMLVYEDEAGETVITYNDPAYLAARHDVAGVETLERMRGAMAGMAGTAGDPASVAGVTLGAGIVEKRSPDSVHETFERLEAAIEGNPNLRLVASLDHAANAIAATGFVLPPARLAIFGNPALGTPMMQAGVTIGIDLPQKMLVYEALDGTTRIAYNDPAWLLVRHAIIDAPGMIEQAAKIAGRSMGWRGRRPGSRWRFRQLASVP